MTKLLPILFVSAPLLLSQSRLLNHHLVDARGRLTAPDSRPAKSVADDYLRASAPQLNATLEELSDLQLVKEYRTAHNGVTHLVYRPRYQGLDVYNVELTVNVDRDGSIINMGGSLAPRPAAGVLPPLSPLAPLRAVRSAAAAVNPRVAERFAPFQTESWDPVTRKNARFAALGFGAEPEGEPVWFAVNGMPVPAWRFSILDEDGVSRYEVVVDDTTQEILSKQELTWFDNSRGLVFEVGSPQPNPNPGVPLTLLPPYRSRSMQSFTGDATASPSGWVAGTETAGNNVTAGLNRLGVILGEMQTSSAPSGDFSFPLELGPGSGNPTGFPDASTVNLFYWVNRAHDLFYSLGFDEPAGNYQKDNFGRGGVAGDALYAYSQFAAAGRGGASLNNAFYTTERSGGDGAPAVLAFYLFLDRTSGVFVDAAFDAEVVVHEYTHAVSTRLIQQLGSTYHGGALGEAMSDFFALELTAPEGAPADGVYPLGAYSAQSPRGGRTLPYSTDKNINPWEYRHFGLVRGYPEIHSDGEIWVQALWEVRAAYIRQFGEAEGRRRVRLAVMDAMKLAPPAPSFIDMRDAVLLADRVDFSGESQEQIWQAFARRGLGTLAMASSGAAIHIVPSSDVPSGPPALRFYDQTINIGEPVRVTAYLPDNRQATVKLRVTTTFGDEENVYLERRGLVYTGTASTTESFSAVVEDNGVLELVPGDTITARLAGGAEPAQAAAAAKLRYIQSAQPGEFTFANETPLGLRGTRLSAQVKLPFAFPFYDRTYSSVWINSSGVLIFNGSISFTCADSTTLTARAAIAPLWMYALTTGGTAQADENVYRSTTDDSITFRFAGEVLSSASARLEPVNFAVTLNADGRIDFRYGPGNKNLISSSCGTIATIGLASGHETFSQPASLYGRTDLENAAGIAMNPPFGAASAPAGILESPAPGANIQNRLTVSGVRYDDGSAIARVDLLIDGESASHSPQTVRREDYCATQAVSGCPNVGFSFAIVPSNLGIAPGAHTVQVRVTNARGASTNIPANPTRFTIEDTRPAAPTGKIETPVDGATISGTVVLRGYAYSPDLAIGSLDLLVDGITFGSPSYNQSRPDICGALPGTPPNCPNVGFTFSLNPRNGAFPLVAGPHTVTLRARDELGKYTEVASMRIVVQ